jgi:hypothetical protein
MRQNDDTERAAGHRGRDVAAVLLLGTLVVLPLTAGCGADPAATASFTPDAQATTAVVPADDGSGPPKSSGGVCERTTVDRKSLPSLARVTVERFVAAVDRGDSAAMRALLDPSGADTVLADLQPVTRLGLLALEDRY